MNRKAKALDKETIMKRSKQFIASILLFSFLILCVSAASYQAPGNTHISAAKAVKAQKRTVKLSKKQSVKKKKKKKKKTAYQKFKPIKVCRWTKKQQWRIKKICKKYHISFEMCIAQAYQESHWNQKAIGDGGLACGAWQIHPSAWNDELSRWGYSRSSMFNLYKACDAYCKIMKAHFKRRDDVQFALMAWRWGGAAGMVKLNSSGPDTYARQIISRSKRYEKRLK